MPKLLSQHTIQTKEDAVVDIIELNHSGGRTFIIEMKIVTDDELIRNHIHLSEKTAKEVAEKLLELTGGAK